VDDLVQFVCCCLVNVVNDSDDKMMIHRITSISVFCMLMSFDCIYGSTVNSLPTKNIITGSIFHS